MSITAISSPNIAFIKYWGNRDDALRLPMADSLSMTLREPTVSVTVEPAETFSVRSFTMGEEREVAGKHLARFERVITLTRQYLATLGVPHALPGNLAISIDSRIPPAVGLASSAAVFSGLAQAIRQLITDESPLTDAQTSIIARLGSGSAARSLFGGYVALEAGEGPAIGASAARQIAPEDHWLLHDIVMIPSTEEKKVGSTEGHAGAHTSRHFAKRIEAIRSRRQRECIEAILARDFERLQAVTEEDCWDMHNVMQTQNPALHYLSDDTHRIVEAVTALRESEHIPVLYTMDAGPTVHLVCTDDAAEKIRSFARAEKGCTVFESQVGPGAHAI